jgi:hypothetical protein
MSTHRRVERIVTPISVIEGAGVRLRRSIATNTLDHVDPILLFDHFSSDDPEDYIAGFPMHPHRGIETVTYMLAGSVEHRDSLGNAGTIGSGDVQWMTSGRGIMHEEMPQRQQGRFDGFQLWLNLPATLKMTEPRYQEVSASTIPVSVRGNGVRIRVIAGNIDGVQGAVTEIITKPSYLDVEMPPNSTFLHEIPAEHAVMVYLFEGAAHFGEDNSSAQLIQACTMLVFGPGDEVLVQTKDSPARFLVLAAEPLHEPVVRYGPFVMNTQAEIEQTLMELRQGTFAR